MEGIKLEAGKYYRTRDGRKAFVAWVGDQFHPEAWAYGFGFIEQGSCSSHDRWGRTGKFWSNETADDRDLVAEWREPKRIKGWINVYRNPYGTPLFFYETKAGADGVADDDRIACIEIDVLEGQGLDGSAR